MKWQSWHERTVQHGKSGLRAKGQLPRPILAYIQRRQKLLFCNNFFFLFPPNHKTFLILFVQFVRNKGVVMIFFLQYLPILLMKVQVFFVLRFEMRKKKKWGEQNFQITKTGPMGKKWDFVRPPPPPHWHNNVILNKTFLYLFSNFRRGKKFTNSKWGVVRPPSPAPLAPWCYSTGVPHASSPSRNSYSERKNSFSQGKYTSYSKCIC